jgi:hypothetical protein
VIKHDGYRLVVRRDGVNEAHQSLSYCRAVLLTALGLIVISAHIYDQSPGRP